MYSWSRVGSFYTSPYEYFLSYILKVKPDLPETSYTIFGKVCHDLLENLYLGNIDNDKLYNEFNEKWENKLLTEKLNFCRNSEERNNSIANKYRLDVEHFFKNHKKKFKNIKVERFLSAKLGNYVFQGYVDAVTKNEDGTYTVIDWKTSAMYSKKDLIKNSGQLIFYAIALNQLGIPFEKIRACFCFLKYCDIVLEKEVNGRVYESTSTIERSKIGEYKNLKSFDDCFVYIDITKENVENVKKYLLDGVKAIEDAEAKYLETNDESIFYDTEESINNNYYYFTNLCGYSRKLHKPLNNYLNKRGIK